MGDDQDFDLDSWIEEARLPERSVTVVGNANLVAQHQELEERLRRVRASHADDERMVDPSVEVAQQLRDVSEQIQASERTFRFRALTSAEAKEIRSGAPKDESGEPDADHVAAAWLAASCVSPQGLTVEKAQAIRAKIGEGQFNSLWAAAFGVSNDRHIDVPLSLAASVILSNRES
jgi:hypothetical protein